MISRCSLFGAKVLGQDQRLFGAKVLGLREFRASPWRLSWLRGNTQRDLKREKLEECCKTHFFHSGLSYKTFLLVL